MTAWEKQEYSERHRIMEYTIKNQYLTVRISSMGGEVQSVCDWTGKEYLWQGDPKIWEDRAPNLFPYIGRMTGKTYSFQGKIYHMDIHGFLPHMEMNLIEQEESFLTLGLRATEKTLEQYPFLFELRIAYRLERDTLDIVYYVENQDAKRMYFGIGGHPGFQVPLEDGETFEDYRLDFGEGARPYRQGMSEDCFVLEEQTAFALAEGRYLKLDHALFDNDAIILNKMPHKVRLGSEKSKREVIVSFPQMEYLGIWHRPFTKAAYVCIEPWSSLPSRKDIVEDLAAQPGLIALDSGNSYVNTWSISVREK